MTPPLFLKLTLLIDLKANKRPFYSAVRQFQNHFTFLLQVYNLEKDLSAFADFVSAWRSGWIAS